MPPPKVQDQPSDCFGYKPPKDLSHLVVGNGHGYSEGGLLCRYFWDSQLYEKISITTSVCKSACTILLGNPNVCIKEYTTFKFHGPSYGGLIPPKDRTIPNEMGRFYSEKVHPDLGEWFMKDAVNRFGFGFEKVSGKDMHEKYGVPLCSE